MAGSGGDPELVSPNLVRTITRNRAMPSTSAWLPWALGSAVFAALTAIFAKIGLEGIDSDFATLVRTFVIVAVLGAFVAFTGKWRNPFALPPKSPTFLVLSAFATGASWVCYFRALKVAEKREGEHRNQDDAQ